MTNKQHAAANLAAQAMKAEQQSTAHLLINAAGRLDPKIDTAALKAQWLEKWLKQNQNRGR